MAPKRKKNSQRVKQDQIYKVQEILDERTGATGLKEYLIKWDGYPSSHNTWEVEENFIDKSVICDYETPIRNLDATIVESMDIKCPAERKSERKCKKRLDFHRILTTGELDSKDDDETSDYEPTVKRQKRNSRGTDDATKIYKKYQIKGCTTPKKSTAETSVTKNNDPFGVKLYSSTPVKSLKDAGVVPVEMTEGDTTCLVTFSNSQMVKLVPKADLIEYYPDECQKFFKSQKHMRDTERYSLTTPAGSPVTQFTRIDPPDAPKNLWDHLISDDDSSFSATGFEANDTTVNGSSENRSTA